MDQRLPCDGGDVLQHARTGVESANPGGAVEQTPAPPQDGYTAQSKVVANFDFFLFNELYGQSGSLSAILFPRLGCSSRVSRPTISRSTLTPSADKKEWGAE